MVKNAEAETRSLAARQTHAQPTDVCHSVRVAWQTPKVTGDPLSEPFNETLREQNRRLARERIIDATVQRVRSTGSTDFTMAEVAGLAGVSLRTLYRYFPNRQDLIDALASVADQVSAAPLPQQLDDLEPWLVQAWRNLLDEEALIRSQHLGPAGAEVRRARIPFYRAVTTDVLRALRPGLSEERLADIVDISLVLTSSAVLFEFIDVLEIPADRGAERAAEAIRTLLAAADPSIEH